MAAHTRRHASVLVMFVVCFACTCTVLGFCNIYCVLCADVLSSVFITYDFCILTFEFHVLSFPFCVL